MLATLVQSQFWTSFIFIPMKALDSLKNAEVISMAVVCLLSNVAFYAHFIRA